MNNTIKVTRSIDGRAVDFEVEHKTKTGALQNGVGDSINKSKQINRIEEHEAAKAAFEADLQELEEPTIEELEKKIFWDEFNEIDEDPGHEQSDQYFDEQL